MTRPENKSSRKSGDFRAFLKGTKNSLLRPTDATFGDNLKQKFAEFQQLSPSKKEAISIIAEIQHEGKANDEDNKCNLCEKVFSSTGNLNRHRLTHTGEKPFVCNMESCGVKFGRPDLLSRHMTNVHGAESNYRCSECLRRFDSVQARFNHKCSPATSFCCSVCSKTFKDKYFLKRHSATHKAKQNLFFCSVCAAGFDYVHLLPRHLKTVHS